MFEFAHFLVFLTYIYIYCVWVKTFYHLGGLARLKKKLNFVYGKLERLIELQSYLTVCQSYTELNYVINLKLLKLIFLKILWRCNFMEEDLCYFVQLISTPGHIVYNYVYIHKIFY